MSTGVIDPIYDLSQRYAQDNSTESRNFLKIFDESTGGSNMNNNPLQQTLLFRINDLYNLLALGRSFLHFQVKLASDAVGTVLPAGEQQAMINGFHKSFRRCNLRFNGQPIDSEHNYLRESINIMEILGRDKNFDEANGSRYGYIPETSDYSVGFTNSGTNDPASNASYAARSSFFDNGTVNNFSVPLHKFFPFLRYFDRVLKGISVEIELELAPPSEILCTRTGAATTAPVLNWHGPGATLHVERRVPSLSVRKDLEEALNKGFELNGFEYTAHSTYKQNFDGNSPGGDFHVSTHVSKPLRVYVAFQNADRLTNTQLNSTLYDNCAIDRLSVMVNGSINPLEPYEPKWSNNTSVDSRSGRMRAYNDLLASQGLDVSPMSDKLNHGTISYQDWALKYPIYVIDLTNVQDTEYTGASEIVVSFERGANAIPFNCFVCVEHMKTANIKLNNTDPQIVVA